MTIGLATLLSAASPAAAAGLDASGLVGAASVLAENAGGILLAALAVGLVLRPSVLFEAVRHVREHPRLESGGRVEAWDEPQCPFGNFVQHITLGPGAAIEKMEAVGKTQRGAFIDYRLFTPGLMIADNDEAVKELLGANVTCPAKRSLGDNLPPYKYLFRRALFMNGGEDWRRIATIANKAMNARAMERSADTVERQVDEVFNRLDLAVKGGASVSTEEVMQIRDELGVEVQADGRIVVDPGEFMKNIVLRVLCKVGFGHGLDDEDRNSILHDFNVLYSESLKPTLVLPGYLDSPIPGGAELKAAIDRLHAIGYKFIERERAARARGEGEGKVTVLSALLFAADEVDGKLTEEEVVHNLYGFIVAGVATTSDSLASSAFMLARHPGVQSRLRGEMAAASGWEGIRLKPYLSAVITEQLRLWPPLIGVPPRTMSKDTVLGGIRVPEGTDVSIHGLTLHRRKKFWGEDAEEFRPERFLEEGSRAVVQPTLPSPLPKGTPAEAFVAFGGGVRPCVARPLAMIEMKLVLASLVRRFQLLEMQPDDFGMTVAFPVVFPKRDLRLEFRPLKVAHAESAVAQAV